jgi:signal transduction histidine kinase
VLVLAHLPVLLALVLLDVTAPWIGFTGTVIALEAALLVVLGRASVRAQEGDTQLQNALWQGHASIRARLEETEQIRSDLIGTVSHEFRTPLTGIRGAALTLLKRSDRLPPEARQQLLQAILAQQERLSRLLENMLTASRATAADPSATAEVDAVAVEVAMLARAAHPDCPDVSVVVEPGTLASIDRHALHQVLANLVDNAQQYGKPGSIPLIAGGRDDRDVWLTVSNEGAPFDEAARLFEPFGQGQQGATRSHEGLGMGLYVVRRLVEVHGGRVGARADGGWVTVEVHLRGAEDRRRSPQHA